MAERGAGGAGQPSQTAAERQLGRRRQELDQWKKKKSAARMRSRNLLTGRASEPSRPVGYTILSVKQERIMDELADEAKIHVMRGPRTGANS
ncbi:hypothetical protein L3Q82_014553 [Scortum barcoo]|uniref:Uncharacterized protein n=1 Tax=Scortum barcoo TaxID=214431 RepID=A0ACB8VXL6_9TELE|nr:hypothetical protein L3Q82_014553 [Scortum barcoo]